MAICGNLIYSSTNKIGSFSYTAAPIIEFPSHLIDKNKSTLLSIKSSCINLNSFISGELAVDNFFQLINLNTNNKNNNSGYRVASSNTTLAEQSIEVKKNARLDRAVDSSSSSSAQSVKQQSFKQYLPASIDFSPVTYMSSSIQANTAMQHQLQLQQAQLLSNNSSNECLFNLSHNLQHQQHQQQQQPQQQQQQQQQQSVNAECFNLEQVSSLCSSPASSDSSISSLSPVDQQDNQSAHHLSLGNLLFVFLYLFF
jgi:hypothetical protein